MPNAIWVWELSRCSNFEAAAVLHGQMGLPLGLQVSGFEHGDAAAFAIAAWIETTLQ